MINGVKTKKLKLIPDERGWLMEILRCDDDIYKKFGQVYITTAYPGIVKAWHLHKKQTDNFTCIQGLMKVALYDSREESSTYREVNEFFIGNKNNPNLLKISGLFSLVSCLHKIRTSFSLVFLKSCTAFFMSLLVM